MEKAALCSWIGDPAWYRSQSSPDLSVDLVQSLKTISGRHKQAHSQIHMERHTPFIDLNVKCELGNLKKKKGNLWHLVRTFVGFISKQ